MATKTESTPEVVPVFKDEMHLDDFLNHMESMGRRELAAAFSMYAKEKDGLKKNLRNGKPILKLLAK